MTVEVDTQDDFDSQNFWVATGEPVTEQEVLDYENGEWEEGREKFLKREDKKDLSQRKSVKALKEQWLGRVQAVIKDMIAQERNKKKGVTKKVFYHILSKLETHKLADIAISVMLDATHHNWSKRRTEEEMGAAIGVLLFDATMRKTSRGRRKMNRLDQKVASQRGFNTAGRRDAILQYANKYGFDGDIWRPLKDNKEARANCSLHGSALVEAVLEEDGLKHLFTEKKEKRGKDSNLTWYVNLKEEVGQEISEVRTMLSQYNGRLGPMICPPNKWGKDDVGPYRRREINHLVPIVRNMGKEQKAAIDKGLRSGDLDDVCEALNAIQETPYRVNSYVLDAITWVKDSINPETGETEIGPRIKGFPKTKKLAYTADDKLPPAEFAALPKKVQIQKGRALANKKRYNLAARGAKDTIYRMIGEAERVLPFDRFWLPHNLDYRGRVYHVPAFGPHNVDYIRAMFMFANRTLVTEDCENFLKLQLANTGGQDKEPLDKRMQWVDANEADILAAGEDYKSTLDFWGGLDSKSFQFLAACREWYLYKQAKAAGEDFYSGLPVAMDATQSGVQHYAAAGLSEENAVKVNLMQNRRPADFYKLCLRRAIRMMKADKVRLAEEIKSKRLTEKDYDTIEKFEAEQASFSANEDFMDEAVAKEREREAKQSRNAFKRTAAYRKLQNIRDLEACQIALRLYKDTIMAKRNKQPKPLASYGRSEMKRNAMTFCYSSSEFGMSDQLFDDWMKPLAALVYEGKLDVHPFGEDEGFHASRYIARIHYAAIRGEVESAADGMDFFCDIAEILARDNHRIIDEAEGAVATHLKFVNRLNFPMIQNYRKPSKKRGKNKVLGFDTEHREWNTDKRSSFPIFTNHVDVKSTKNGIAPNVIHQQDSMHLLWTVLDFVRDEGGINFLGIHDSFATTAAEGAMLATSLRRAFIQIYLGYNLYEDFLAQAKARHSDPDNVEWPKPPEQGNLDVRCVWESDNFFS